MSPSFGDVGDQNDHLPCSSKSRLYNKHRVPHVSRFWRRGRPERPFALLFKEQALQQTPGAPCLPSLETWETRTTTCPVLKKQALLPTSGAPCLPLLETWETMPLTSDILETNAAWTRSFPTHRGLPFPHLQLSPHASLPQYRRRARPIRIGA
jgi:hypothetical protein